MTLGVEDRLDSRRVRYFMQVMECGSVRGAAEALDMDASAVSRAIGLLEHECGARLFERRGRGVVPTDAGLMLAAHLQRAAKQQQQLFAQFDSLRKLERGHVDLVAGEGFVDWLMRHSLRSFMAAHPGITVDLEIGNTDEIVQRIVDERAHVGVVFRPPQDERLRSHHAHPLPIQALVLDTHPLARQPGPLALADLVPHAGAMLQRGFGLRQHIEAAEVSEGIRLQPVFTTTSFHAVAQFVAAGLGYTLGTGLVVPARPISTSVVALPMRNPLLSQGQVQVVSRHGRLLPPAAGALLQHIVEDMGRQPSGRKPAPPR
ncbi:LysR family transcriptional regulator [Pseudorhodoferax sp.]|uniref:LysR family transcriptional regulator n=1 Tax=Pseudorhodoferax sp. TaxID=1993553 RepID=UPI002DD6576D|nr:LysR family transcriptional regulator [Pseudorhodoferax sp.]